MMVCLPNSSSALYEEEKNQRHVKDWDENHDFLLTYLKNMFCFILKEHSTLKNNSININQYVCLGKKLC